jgi:uncharacterized protein
MAIIAPPFTLESATQKVRLAEDAWNTRDPEKVSLAYTPDSRWRNRSEFVNGRTDIVKFLARKWAEELEYRLIKELWAFADNRIAVRYVGAMFHDMGLTERYQTSQNRFEVDTANAARNLLRRCHLLGLLLLPPRQGPSFPPPGLLQSDAEVAVGSRTITETTSHPLRTCSAKGSFAVRSRFSFNGVSTASWYRISSHSW